MADCVTKEFQLNQEGNLELYFRGFYNLYGWGKYEGVNGELSDCGGSLEGSTCMATMGGSSHKKAFKMLATDYKNYDIQYGCKPFWGIFYSDSFSISSRTMEMSDTVQAEVRTVVKSKLPHLHLQDSMYWTKQGEDRCQYYWMSDNQG